MNSNTFRSAMRVFLCTSLSVAILSGCAGDVNDERGGGWWGGASGFGGGNGGATAAAGGFGGGNGSATVGAGGIVVVSSALSDFTVDTIDPSPWTDMSAGSTPIATKVNFYSVTNAVTLRLIEMYLGSASATTTTVGCVVYESDTQTSPTYARISSVRASTTSHAGWASCSGIFISLKAGSFYAIGVWWGGQENQTYYYHSTPAAFPAATSFGSLISGASVNNTGLDSFPWYSSDTLYYSQILGTRPQP